MKSKVLRWIVATLMLIQSGFFIVNIYVFNNRTAALEMHEDLPSTASPFAANAKVVLCFVVGILFLVTGISLFRKKYSNAIFGVIAGGIFVLSYLLEIILWYHEHQIILFYFSMIGTINLLFALYSW